ncbi:CBS domain-containing protein [Thiolapillus brandeum]|uniref:CBS domain-containing protein n=1 Tax=Thiolapillus brandeum TaxID=1076588 RepID=A0A7U6GH44_9GAMM|nr:CBS domain-containing protein [Thiolapillus brandeum]BAO43550.1 conserved hypothetical protein [Thiolapillus brandeum]
MLVKDVMTRGARSVTRDTPIQEVASLMCLYRYSGLPVVEDEKLIGFIAEKDVLAQLFPSVEDAMEGMATIDLKEKAREYKSIMSRKVGDLMTRGAKTVSPDMPVLKAAIIMANNRFRRIPVAEGDKLVGMLSLGDIHKAIFHQSLTES